jgi:saccharopine dehydrogenase (NAD+, L-lysine forming)
MDKIKIGIIREGKIPPDRRVALMPDQCVELMEKFPNLEVFIQPSDIRCFSNNEYAEKGLTLTEDLSHCDILFGIKEVPIHLLIPGKTYYFFSHTLKKQPHNQKLLQAILEKKVEMIDYEVLTDPEGNRLIAFGRFAGIVGTYNAMLLFGRKFRRFRLKPAHKCFDMTEVFNELRKVSLPPIKIIVTGTGRVGSGSKQILDHLKIKEVSPEELITGTFREPVYAMLSTRDYNERIADGGYDRKEFFTHPEKYRSSFQKYLNQADMFIAAAYWEPRAPVLFTRDEMLQQDFRIKIIADITCDINGSIPTTLKPCTIYDPAYDYNPHTHSIEPLFSGQKNITVMAIDNLPGELPRDASKDFGNQLMTHIFPLISRGEDPQTIIRRGAMTTKTGCLTEKFRYLDDYVKGC